MDITQLAQWLEHSVQLNPLPAVLGALLLGILATLLSIKLSRSMARRQPSSLIPDKDGLAALDRIHDPPPKNGGLGRTSENPEHQIRSLTNQIVQLSSVCERLTSQNLDVRAELKRERSARRQIQDVVRRYSQQLDSIAKSDGKLWLNAPNGHGVPFLPLP
jgi:hypothetical protein